MDYAYLFSLLACLILGGASGFIIGLYQANILKELKELRAKPQEPPKEIPKPTVTMGAYTPPREISTAVDSRKVGIVESKTPERVEWEYEQSVEKEVLGR